GLVDHALFVSFFPTVSAGPIARQRDVVPQLPTRRREVDYDSIARGVFLLSLGLFQKAGISDGLINIVTQSFAAGADPSQLQAWASSLGFSLQLYYDFSGYSDMAVAAGLMLGMRLPNNFDAPYRSTSIIEFWRRWHITLSDFITTYLYTPMVRA